MNYQNNTYKKRLHSLARILKEQTSITSAALYICFCGLWEWQLGQQPFSDNNILHKKERNFKEWNKNPIFQEAALAIKKIQVFHSNLEKKPIPSSSNILFYLSDLSDLSPAHINVPIVFTEPNESIQLFEIIKSASYFLIQSRKNHKGQIYLFSHQQYHNQLNS